MKKNIQYLIQTYSNQLQKSFESLRKADREGDAESQTQAEAEIILLNGFINSLKALVNVHPEQKDGEIFIINLKEGESFDVSNDTVTSTRIGEVAYSLDGRIIEDMKPLFGTLNLL